MASKETKAYFKKICKDLSSDFNDIPIFVMDEWEKLKAEFEQYKLESIKWGIEDFIDLEVDGFEINEEQAQEALEEMIHQHDCNYGITWDSLSYYVEVFGTKVEEGKEKWRNNE